MFPQTVSHPRFREVSKMRTFRSWSGFLIVIAVLLLTTTARAQDWPQWRGPNRDGVAPGVSAAWPKELKEEWKVTVGIGHSSPLVAAGRIYVFARQGEAETLLSLDAATGKEIWRSSQPISYEMHPAATGHGKGPKSTPVGYQWRPFLSQRPHRKVEVAT